MTTARTTEPEALVDQIARVLDETAHILGRPDYYGPDLVLAFASARVRTARKSAANILAGPLAPILADRDRLAAQVEAMRAERDEALRRAKVEKDSADMYANAWVRELGGKLFPKRFHIDACVKTTRWMRERSDRLAVIEAEQKAADLVAEYGPSNEMVAARVAARSALAQPEPEGESRALIAQTEEPRHG